MEHRIHIVGASGTGKTTLGLRLSELLGIPVFHLDEVARLGGGPGRLRSDAERAAAIATILTQSAWITEGVHLGWTEKLLERSTLIVWLDDIPASLARRRITRGHSRGATSKRAGAHHAVP
jgi:adenylate kinase family enzyme